MPASHPDITQGLAAFGSLLEAEYGRPFADWQDGAWTDRESLQVSRALGLLLKEPIAHVSARPEAAIAASDTGSRRDWMLDDAKIAAPDWEASWQWQLLADIDNAAKAASGGMMTPSDPRLYLLTIRYDRDFFAIIAGHLIEFLCERPSFETCIDMATIRDRLKSVPGFAQASTEFLAGVAFLIQKLGPKAFCGWCEERCDAKNDDAL
jgi:hypothetical protein